MIKNLEKKALGRFKNSISKTHFQEKWKKEDRKLSIGKYSK